MTVIKTHTDYDFEQLEELQRVAAKTFARKQNLRRRSFCLSWGVFCMGVGLLLVLRKGGVLLPLICCIIGALLLVRGVFFYQISAWSANRTMEENTESSYFTLEKDNILVVRGKESGRYPYAQCQQLLEAERSIYVIMEDGRGLMLDKANVRGGTVEEMRSWLVEKCSKPLTWVGRKGTGPEEKAAKP